MSKCSHIEIRTNGNNISQVTIDGKPIEGLMSVEFTHNEYEIPILRLGLLGLDVTISMDGRPEIEAQLG